MTADEIFAMKNRQAHLKSKRALGQHLDEEEIRELTRIEKVTAAVDHHDDWLARFHVRKNKR